MHQQDRKIWKKWYLYKIKCNDCDSYYIGQTGRTFQERYKEHTKSIYKLKPFKT